MKPTPANLENPPGPAPAEASAEMPVWLQRLFMIVYVVFCIQLGIVMVMLPWGDRWLNNSLVAGWPAVKHLLAHPFVRGAVSGLGFLDLWVGISEAVRYRDRR